MISFEFLARVYRRGDTRDKTETKLVSLTTNTEQAARRSVIQEYHSRGFLVGKLLRVVFDTDNDPIRNPI